MPWRLRLDNPGVLESSVGPQVKEKSMRFIVVMMLATLSTACATSNMQVLSTRSYELGVVQTATIGNPILVDQIGSVTKRKEWVGRAFAKDGWKYSEEYSGDFLRKELIYSGKAGSVIEIAYREFRSGLAAPAFY